MIFTTPEQFVVLAALLVGGWLIGYASAPSPRKWKRRVAAQSDSFTQRYDEIRGRLRAAERRAADAEARADACRAGHAGAERLPPARSTQAPVPAPIGAAEPASRTGARPTGSVRDDLLRLRGVDDVLNTRLFGLGVTRFEDVETLSAQDEMALEQRLDVPAGYIAREQWRAQAALLRAGRGDDHAAQSGEAAVPA